jgi:hypothetical protein
VLAAIFSRKGGVVFPVLLHREYNYNLEDACFSFGGCFLYWFYHIDFVFQHACTLLIGLLILKLYWFCKSDTNVRSSTKSCRVVLKWVCFSELTVVYIIIPKPQILLVFFQKKLISTLIINCLLVMQSQYISYRWAREVIELPPHMSAKDKNTEHSDSFADLDFFISRQVFESYSFQVSLMFHACFVCILICLYHLPWVAPHCGTSYQVGKYSRRPIYWL